MKKSERIFKQIFCTKIGILGFSGILLIVFALLSTHNSLGWGGIKLFDKLMMLPLIPMGIICVVWIYYGIRNTIMDIIYYFKNRKND